MELFPYTPQMIDNQYAISDAIQDFISFELLSFGWGKTWALSSGTKISL